MFKLIKLIIIVMGIYIGVSCAIPWVKFFVFKNSAYKVLSLSKQMDHGEIMEYLLEKADELNVKISKKNIEIEDHSDGSLYTIEYQSEVGFPLVENKVIFAHEFSKFRDK